MLARLIPLSRERLSAGSPSGASLSSCSAPMLRTREDGGDLPALAPATGAVEASSLAALLPSPSPCPGLGHRASGGRPTRRPQQTWGERAWLCGRRICGEAAGCRRGCLSLSSAAMKGIQMPGAWERKLNKSVLWMSARK